MAEHAARFPSTFAGGQIVGDSGQLAMVRSAEGSEPLIDDALSRGFTASSAPRLAGLLIYVTSHSGAASDICSLGFSGIRNTTVVNITVAPLPHLHCGAVTSVSSASTSDRRGAEINLCVIAGDRGGVASSATGAVAVTSLSNAFSVAGAPSAAAMRPTATPAPTKARPP